MKNVLVLGAGGVLGSEITRQLEQQPDVRQTGYDVRRISYARSNGKNICADVCDENALQQAVGDVDFVVCSLNGDWLSQARTLVSVLHGQQNVRIIWVTGMGMSGSETNADVQITLDESGLQVGCDVGKAVFTWLNPDYVMSLPDHILAYGQMTAFVQLSINYLNLTRSPLAEHYAEASMKTILECLRRSLADKNDTDARGTLLLNSSLALSGINDLGREGEFAQYPLQSFAQRYLGLDYPHALCGLFPYWLKEIYRASADKAIFFRYFSEILGVSGVGKTEEALLQEALAALKALYREFGIAFTYGALASDPQDHAKLVEIIGSFGPMPCSMMRLTTEVMAKMIEDAITGNLN